MENKKNRILEAAIQLFVRYGFKKTTMDEIAQAAQVGKGTLYSYFTGKEEILAFLVDREITRGMKSIVAAMDRERTAKGKLRKIVEISLDYFHRNELVGKVMAMDPGLVLSLITEKNREFQQVSIAGLNALLEQGHEQGEFRSADFKKTAYIIDGLIRSFHYLNYLGLEMYRPEELVDSVCDFVFQGILEQDAG